MWRERSQDSLVWIHFWRGVLGNLCPSSSHHGRIASPNPLVWRKRHPLSVAPVGVSPSPSTSPAVEFAGDRGPRRPPSSGKVAARPHAVAHRSPAMSTAARAGPDRFGGGYSVRTMDLTYPPEAEEFRVQIRRWLKENLPEGWGEPDFTMTADQRKDFNQEWTAKLFGGGWICASWPAEYGGKGLSLLEQVVLNEEFARAGAPLRADFFGDTLVGPTLLQWGTEEQKKQFISGHPQGRDRLVPGLQRARRRIRPGLAQDPGGARRRRVGRQRPEGLDHPGPVRRLHLPVGADRRRTSPKHAGISYLLVPMRQEGVEVRPIRQIDGTEEFNEVFFTNARCPKENVVGGVNNGWKVAMTTLGFERGTSSTTGHRRFLKEFDQILEPGPDQGADR